MDEIHFLVNLAKGLRDAGLTPLFWIIALIILSNRIPKLKNFFLKEIAIKDSKPSNDTDIIPGRRNGQAYVIKADCHEAMHKIDTQFQTVNYKIDATSEKIDKLTLTILEGKLK